MTAYGGLGGVLNLFGSEVIRVARQVGVEGKLGAQAKVPGVSGVWKELTESVNLMAHNLTTQVREIARVTTAVAKGDLTKTVTVDVQGEILQLKNTINTMIEQLSSFAAEVTPVAREVGTEGQLGGQAQVRGVSGVWRELTENVNSMATNLTDQVRNIAEVVTAVAEGDLSRQITVDAQGEILTLKTTINSTVEKLSHFSEEVTRVARLVGSEGTLGVQANVEDVAGVWRDLTSNVNELAGNLTRQVRAIGDVATAVTKGDLTRTIAVEAQGEVALLKDNINQMIQTLANTTRANQDQDWLKTNLARFTRMLQGQRDLTTVAEQVLDELAPVVNAQYGSFFMARQEESRESKDGKDGKDGRDGKSYLELFAAYGHDQKSSARDRYELGQSLVGEAARQRKPIAIQDTPDGYAAIGSSLGKSAPKSLILYPVLFEGEVKGIIELASLHAFSQIQLAFIEQLIESLGIVVATIEATMRTDELLRSSQEMAETLKKQQDELRYTNEQLEEKARQLTAQRDEVARKNQEVELAKQELEQNAEQLALTSKYKSEFLANMSHELRTPLNSLLILSRQLADNAGGNLEDKQVEYARTIHDAGSDLLALINEILDLAKIESGTMAVNVDKVEFNALHEYIDRSFAHLAREKGLSFAVRIADALPNSIFTDEMRLRQVLRNLISNALKFTDEGSVTVSVKPAGRAMLQRVGAHLRNADEVIAFSVVDTGIGIRADQQQRVFEAFQQGDGGSSRKYGGTGLGLSISREIAALLRGELILDSSPGKGSTFTLLLPRVRDAAEAAASPSAHRDVNVPMEPGERALLLVGSDEPAIRLAQSVAPKHGFRFVPAHRIEDGVHFARTLEPAAIILDFALSDAHTWVLLDLLKHAPATRHVPTAVIASEADKQRALINGAVAVLSKEGGTGIWQAGLETIESWLDDAATRRCLVVEGQLLRDLDVKRLLACDRLELTTARDAAAVVAAVEEQPFDCLLVDQHLDGTDGITLLQDISSRSNQQNLRAVLFHEGRLNRQQESALGMLSSALPTKHVGSLAQTIDALSMFLHIPESKLSSETRQILGSLLHCDPSLRGRRVLIVDDDVRNTYAITAVLEPHGIDVSFAENGQDALRLVEERQNSIDLVLMDIMMPGMDGYEATQRIRALPGRENLPIVALTAKAMRTDRAKCLEAGASDYITKPVEPEMLISALRVWLSDPPVANPKSTPPEA